MRALADAVNGQGAADAPWPFCYPCRAPRLATMEYRQLGKSGLRVSTVTLGTMGFGGTGWATPVGQ
ncbi:MAG: aldo/keto reductase, partial [Leifsonia sp.]|nr:aldo/keto reductase [Leifsonia sp.]